MIKDNQRYFNRLHFLLDVLVIVGSYMLAWYLKFQTEFFDHIGDRLSFEKYMFALWGIVPGYLLLYLAFHMYTSKRVQGRRLEIGNIIKANILGVLGFITLLYVIGQHDFSREMVVIFFVINVMAEVALRMFIRYVLRMMRKKGFNIKHILLVGYSRASEAYIDRMAAFPQWGYHVVGILDDNVEAGTNYNGTNVIGKIDLLENIVKMSPGTQTNILMEYIVSKQTEIPLLIDQPESKRLIQHNTTTMKKLSFLMLTLLGMVMFTACGDDNDEPENKQTVSATINTRLINNDDETVTFSQSTGKIEVDYTNMKIRLNTTFIDENG